MDFKHLSRTAFTIALAATGLAGIAALLKKWKPVPNPVARALEPSPFESVNFHFTRVCNYSCKFCFHTAKSSRISSLEDAKTVLCLLRDAGMKKINFAGGEPFTKPEYLGELVQYCKEELLLPVVTIVTNGSKITEEWLRAFGKFVDIVAVSCDSAENDTNDAIGRYDQSDARSQVSIVRHVARLLKDHTNIAFKMNTVVCKLNFEEDMNDLISAVNPIRWKVFQVLAVEGENQGSNARRQVDELLISKEEFAQYVARHSKQQALVVEDNDTMRDSYVLVDEDLCCLDNSSGAKVKSLPILEHGVYGAFQSVKFDRAAFERRNGAFYEKMMADIEDTC